MNEACWTILAIATIICFLTLFSRWLFFKFLSLSEPQWVVMDLAWVLLGSFSFLFFVLDYHVNSAAKKNSGYESEYYSFMNRLVYSAEQFMISINCFSNHTLAALDTNNTLINGFDISEEERIRQCEMTSNFKLSVINSGDFRDPNYDFVTLKYKIDEIIKHNIIGMSDLGHELEHHRSTLDDLIESRDDLRDSEIDSSLYLFSMMFFCISITLRFTLLMKKYNDTKI